MHLADFGCFSDPALLILASSAAVWKVVSSTDIDEGTFRILGGTISVKLYEYVFASAGIATGALVLILAGNLARACLSYLSVPQWFPRDRGLLPSTTASFVVIMPAS